MELIIYTTYATAMRHRPEDLAASGGLQPLGSRGPRERRLRTGWIRARSWLGIVLARAWPRRREVKESTQGRVAIDTFADL